MIKFQDQFNITRGIEFTISFCGKYINLTLYAEKKDYGSTIQIPVTKINEIKEELNEL